MKNIILTIFAFAAIAIGTVACSKCNTSNIKIGVGTITGIDGTMCTCCGGYIIKMNNQTYYIQTDLGQKNVALSWKNIKIPVDVKVKYSAEDSCGKRKFMTVEAIEIH